MSISDRIWWMKYRLRYRLPEEVVRWVAHKLPRRLVYFTTIRAYADAWAAAGNKHPNDLTFDEVVSPWNPKGDAA